MANRVDAALVQAVKRGDIEAVNALLTGGADPCARDDPDHPLPAKVLLEWRLRGWRPVRNDDQALLVSVGVSHTVGLLPVFRVENTEVVRALVDAGADVNCVGAFGNTPLIYGAMSARPATVEVLVALGADPDIVNAQGSTALLIACAVNAPAAVARELVRAGANPNVASWNGYTPLLHAVTKGNLETAAALLEGGADVNAKNKFGEDAVHLARCRNHQAVARLLVQYGAPEPPRKRKSRAGGRRM